MTSLQTARINGINMTFAVAGQSGAPAVVLHHPLATRLSFWDELTAALSPAYRVVRFDARGHGASEGPPGRYAFETLAGDVVGLMDHLGIALAGFVGLSMGGMVGQYLGLLHPARFSCLALVSTTSKTAADMRHLWSERVVVARQNGMGSQVAPAMVRWLAPTAQSGRPDLVQRCAGMIETTPLEGYAGWCGAIEHLDTTSRLGAIKLPVRVIVGRLDPATPVAASEVIQRAIPGADLVVLDGVSHMLAIEAPAAFHAALLPFLAAHVAG